jgi:hypothetical protein
MCNQEPEAWPTGPGLRDGVSAVAGCDAGPERRLTTFEIGARPDQAVDEMAHGKMVKDTIIS